MLSAAHCCNIRIIWAHILLATVCDCGLFLHILVSINSSRKYFGYELLNAPFMFIILFYCLFKIRLFRINKEHVGDDSGDLYCKSCHTVGVIPSI